MGRIFDGGSLLFMKLEFIQQTVGHRTIQTVSSKTNHCRRRISRLGKQNCDYTVWVCRGIIHVGYPGNDKTIKVEHYVIGQSHTCRIKFSCIRIMHAVKFGYRLLLLPSYLPELINNDYFLFPHMQLEPVD